MALQQLFFLAAARVYRIVPKTFPSTNLITSEFEKVHLVKELNIFTPYLDFIVFSLHEPFCHVARMSQVRGVVLICTHRR